MATRITLILVLNLFWFNGLAQTFTTQANGDWMTAGTWTPAGPPTAGATVVINHNVIMSNGSPATVNVNSITVNDGGQLWLNDIFILNVATGFIINSATTNEVDLILNWQP